MTCGRLWSFSIPGFLGTQGRFQAKLLFPDPGEPRSAKRGADFKAAHRTVRPTAVKTDKCIIADLPEKLEMKVFCTLTKEQASLYAAVVDEAIPATRIEAEGIQRKGIVLATLSSLKQVCNHPAQFLRR